MCSFLHLQFVVLFQLFNKCLLTFLSSFVSFYLTFDFSLFTFERWNRFGIEQFDDVPAISRLYRFADFTRSFQSKSRLFKFSNHTSGTKPRKFTVLGCR